MEDESLQSSSKECSTLWPNLIPQISSLVDRTASSKMGTILCLCHTAINWQSWNLSPCMPDSKLRLLTIFPKIIQNKAPVLLLLRMRFELGQYRKKDLVALCPPLLQLCTGHHSLLNSKNNFLTSFSPLLEKGLWPKKAQVMQLCWSHQGKQLKYFWQEITDGMALAKRNSATI